MGEGRSHPIRDGRGTQFANQRRETGTISQSEKGDGHSQQPIRDGKGKQSANHRRERDSVSQSEESKAIRERRKSKPVYQRMETAQPANHAVDTTTVSQSESAVATFLTNHAGDSFIKVVQSRKSRPVLMTAHSMP